MSAWALRRSTTTCTATPRLGSSWALWQPDRRGSFELDGQRYELDRTAKAAIACMAGGRALASSSGRPMETPMAGEATALRMRYVSLDGEQGFPAICMSACATRWPRLRGPGASTTKPRPTSPRSSTSPPRLLQPRGRRSVLDHRLQLHAQPLYRGRCQADPDRPCAPSRARL